MRRTGVVALLLINTACRGCPPDLIVGTSRRPAWGGDPLKMIAGHDLLKSQRPHDGAPEVRQIFPMMGPIPSFYHSPFPPSLPTTRPQLKMKAALAALLVGPFLVGATLARAVEPRALPVRLSSGKLCICTLPLLVLTRFICSRLHHVHGGARQWPSGQLAGGERVLRS